jgi:AcrR family transcriptional regulator
MAGEAPERGPGQDPQKRRQIIEGARRLFFAQGFDAASMGDIALAAGVSKGTLYVYFDSKERLFGAVVREEIEKFQTLLFRLDPDDHDVPAVLGRVGRGLVRAVTTSHIVRAMRTVVAVGDRMPELGTEYYDEGPRAGIGRMARYLEQQAQLGILDIDDPDLAAAQFLDMAQTTMARPLLFGAGAPPSAERIDKVVDSAVRVFMAAYGRQTAGGRA